MKINNNLVAVNTQRNLGNVNSRVSRSMEKLSSGLRISRAADDAAGLTVSENLRGQIAGVKAQVRSQQDTYSALQVAEGALNEVSSMLIRSKELVTSSITADTAGTTAINAELSQISKEIGNIVNNTEFNGNKLLASGSPDFTMFADAKGTTDVLTAIDASTLTAVGTPYVAGTTTIADVQADIEAVAGLRGQIGGYQNRLEASSRNFESTIENLTSAESRIRDVDMASEMVSFSKDQIIAQAGQAMLVQANQIPQGVLGLLR